MVADAQQQPQPTSVEDEAVKRNTDCVYFLASPLTCKKGSECEYRHSEYARVNPRDCWYWLNSACLNPKCAFRHPPIEGLLGVQTPQSSAGFPVPSAQTTVAPTVTPVVPVTQSSIKQPVTCVFFQKGYCMKGDKCSFLHGPNPSTTAKPAQASSNPPQGIESSNIKVFSGGLKNCSQEQKLPHVNTAKSVVGAQPHRAELISKQLTLPGNGFGIERSLLPIKPYNDERIRGKAMVPPPMSNGVPNNHHPNRVSSDHGFHNGKEADEFMRESSPGFDVLVENELRDEEYFHGEDRQYDMDRPISAADVDPDRFHDNPRSFEPRSRGQYDSWEPRRDRDRKPVGPPQLDRRGYRKSISPDNIEGLDLRHQLSKHKRVNGSRSSLDRYDAHERHGDDRSHRSSRRDSQQHKGPLSSRLRGRINFGPESRVDRELDRPRSSRGRVSPKRPETTYEGRFRDRLKGRVSDGRSGRDGREMVSYEGIVDLSAAVKGSSEVRRGGAEIIKEPSILGKRKSVASQPQPTSEDVSFDGPMPLSEILKRKREASQQRETPQAGLDREEGELGNKLERDDVAVETMEDEKVIGDLEVGDGVAYDEAALEDQELDQAHGEYEYEELEVEEEEDEGEYEVEGEEEYLEDEEDDFAKKIGVLSS